MALKIGVACIWFKTYHQVGQLRMCCYFDVVAIRALGFVLSTSCKCGWPGRSSFILISSSFLIFISLPFCYQPCISRLLLLSGSTIFDNKRQDPTGLTALLQSTDLVGVVHTLYSILLHSFSPESSSQSQEPYSPGVIQVALQGIRFLNSFALLDLSAFQVSTMMLEFSINKETVFLAHVIAIKKGNCCLMFVYCA